MNFNGGAKASGDEAGALGVTNTQPVTTAGSSLKSAQGPSGHVNCFPNGNQSLEFEEFIEVIKDSCSDSDSAENYLVFAFSMFDREK